MSNAGIDINISQAHSCKAASTRELDNFLSNSKHIAKQTLSNLLLSDCCEKHINVMNHNEILSAAMQLFSTMNIIFHNFVYFQIIKGN